MKRKEQKKEKENEIFLHYHTRLHEIIKQSIQRRIKAETYLMNKRKEKVK